jgi:flagellar biosynthetic protein FliQ
MTPEVALNELRQALEVALIVAAPLLLSVLAIGVVVGILQAATQINEPTIAFVAKAIGLVAVLSLTGSWMMAKLVEFTIALIQRIPALIS